MGKTVAQNSSANIVIGPLVDISGDALPGLTIANAAIVLVKESSVSAARNATTSALSVGPGHYRVVLNSTDTDTLGTLTIIVSGSAALAYSKDVEIWQSTTWNLFFGSADQILTSAAASAIVSVGVNTALVNRQVPTSAAVSGIVIQALTDHDVATSADVSVITSVVVKNVFAQLGVSGQMVNNALTSWDVPTSADVSAIVSVVVQGALTNYGVPTSAAMSAAMSAVGKQVLTDYDVPTSADVSVLVSVGVNAALANYGVPTSAAMSAAMSAVGALVLTNYDVPTSADVSAITVGVLAGHKVNIGQVNDVSVSGTGTSADPWRPA